MNKENLMTVNITLKDWKTYSFEDVYHIFTFGSDLVIRCGVDNTDKSHTFKKDDILKFDVYSNHWMENL